MKAILIVASAIIITFGALQYAHADWSEGVTTIGKAILDITHNSYHILEYLNWILKEEIKQTKLLEDANCISYYSIGMLSTTNIDKYCKLDYGWDK